VIGTLSAGAVDCEAIDDIHGGPAGLVARQATSSISPSTSDNLQTSTFPGTITLTAPIIYSPTGMSGTKRDTNG
jgi:hypothetical protein